jgi:uncharacterized protein YbjT (DUF2867 family)
VTTDTHAIVVTGATGRQGGAVARRVLEAGFSVRALVRDPATAAARALEQAGADLYRGSFDDVDSLRAAMRGAYGLFSMQNFWEAGSVREFLQAKRQLEAAKAEGIAQVVYSSAATPPGSGVPHAETKAIIEAMVRDAYADATIVRGVWYIEGLRPAAFDLERGTFSFVTAPEQPHVWVSVDDIGRLTAGAFAAPAAFAGRDVTLASAASTGIEMAAAFAHALGEPLRYEQLTGERFEAAMAEIIPSGPYNRELHRIYSYIRDVNFTVDWNELESVLPERHTLDTWIECVWLPAQVAGVDRRVCG